RFCVIDRASACLGNVLHEIPALVSAALPVWAALSPPRVLLRVLVLRVCPGDCHQAGGNLASARSIFGLARRGKGPSTAPRERTVARLSPSAPATPGAEVRVAYPIHQHIRFGDSINGLVVADFPASRILSIR